LHPMIVNKGKAHFMDWYAKLKRKDLATFGVSKKPLSKEGLGLKRLVEVFDEETQESTGNEYCLLILAWQTSHFNWEFFDYYLNAKIVPQCLP
ncbi:hypothetical protein C7212DRAFT_58576, partial [Tuber magnatum]